MIKRSVKRSPAGIPDSLFYRCALALGAALCMGFLLLLLSTAVAYAQPDPALLARPLALASLYVSSCIGGYIAGKGAARPYVGGAICGIGVALCLLPLSLIPAGSAGQAPSPLLVIAMYLAVVVDSTLGAWISIRKAKKHPHRHKSRRRK